MPIAEFRYHQQAGVFIKGILAVTFFQDFR